jgi:hypothetical protein
MLKRLLPLKFVMWEERRATDRSTPSRKVQRAAGSLERPLFVLAPFWTLVDSHQKLC